MKKILALLMIFVLIFSLSACGKSKSESDSSSGESLQTSGGESSDAQSDTGSDALDSEDRSAENAEPDSGKSGGQGTASNAPAGNDKPQTGNDKPQTGNAGGTGDGGKTDTGNDETDNGKYITYQGVIFHDAQTGYVIGDYISLSLKETGDGNYEALYMRFYGGGIPKVIPEHVTTSIFFSQKFPKEYREDRMMYIDNAMPETLSGTDDAAFNELFTPERSKNLYKCMYNGELYLSIHEFESFPTFEFTSAKADQNGNLEFANDVCILGGAGGDEYKYAINVQNFKLSADKNTITATAKGAKYSADVTLYRTDETKFGLWGGNDLADISAEEFAKLVTIVK